jgi:hypothetical protein
MASNSWYTNTNTLIFRLSSTAVYGNMYKCCLLYQHNINTNTNALVNRWMTTKHAHKSLSPLSSTTFFLFLPFSLHSEIQVLSRKYSKNWKSTGLVTGFSFLKVYLDASRVTYGPSACRMLRLFYSSSSTNSENEEMECITVFAKNIWKLLRQNRRINKDMNTASRKGSGQWLIYTYDIAWSMFGLSLQWLWSDQPQISSDIPVC